MNIIKKLELLAPAKDLECGMAAINCGADAVYIGAPKFGARSAAGNSIEDIEKLINYAHKYWAKVYVTLNTILYDNELNDARDMAIRLYDAGIDALIIQDMALLEMDLPPVPLFASTQTHNYSAEKVKFLESAGIKRVILARELSLHQIKEIKAATSIELESFVHGALCVSYSGQCYFSHAISGRSANRGECMQACRMQYSLEDSKGKVLIKDKYLLSLKDLNLSSHLNDLIDAGITSFKIEGRLKDITYVKNVTSYYRQKLDNVISAKLSVRRATLSVIRATLSVRRVPMKSGCDVDRAGCEVDRTGCEVDCAECDVDCAALNEQLRTDNSELFTPASSGQVHYSFVPDPDKTFNRGYTDYFLTGKPGKMASFNTQKSTGEYLGKVKSIAKDSFVIDTKESLQNGDGICFFGKDDVLQGMNVTRAEGNRVFVQDLKGIYAGASVYRNYGHSFSKELKRDETKRLVNADLELVSSDDKLTLYARDEDGNCAYTEMEFTAIPADNPERMIETIKKQLRKTGDSMFLVNEASVIKTVPFIPVSKLNELRRNVLNLLEAERLKNYPANRAEIIKNSVRFPAEVLDYKGNVVNHLSNQFYERHGVKSIDPGFELLNSYGGKILMTCKYCIKRELNICPKLQRSQKLMAAESTIGITSFTEPLYLRDRKRKYRLVFDCKRCEMAVIYEEL